MNDQSNIERIKAVYYALEELGNQVVFVGGAAVSLYKDRPASETRFTEDVDIVVELATYNDYAAIENQLRQKGFINDVESGIVCRYTIYGITVDVLPTEGTVLGFRNRWYADGFKTSILYSIALNEQVRLFDAPHFLAAKLEAFNDRGNKDGRMSSDFEDIVYVLNNRSTVWKELQEASGAVRIYLKEEFSKLLKSDNVYEWVSAHLDFSEQTRMNSIVNSLKNFV